ncbi:MAG: carbon monoxide dehydrogenase subunit G [Chloroflexia bacterium]
MKLDGDYTMDAPRQVVFDTLMNVDALRNCLPGVETFEEVGEGRYKAHLRAGLAGIKGSFTGEIVLADATPPESYTLQVDGDFSGGFVNGAAQIQLVDEGEKTRVHYSGEGQVGGRLASVGQRLIAPAAKRIVGQFFKCMEGQIKHE